MKLDSRDLVDIIKNPVVTEKATRLMELNQYTFDVDPRATKPMIKQVIEQIFEVKVIGINTLNLPRKKRRVGKYIGFKPRYKRAIVTLEDGEPIRKVLFPDL
ncbi:MAG: 50S ribosomal protein L23 [Trichodesmium sp. St16_bin4-tuft]|uniref:Large ribosomal subunit protein uL23 n=1 Tax=Trichodesmium erythraeum (strain IMS101) TaxID=203124 RepID=RL23_TRIEI|nr:RecName: Full=Large ribosomal subunit protein uL23; AltName: Full=50S ribosomal protein L23 [Trichodesmium erythraeum IMS101]MBS9769024.1 50S ribosomal protein L23 [Trichodesmium erythraeum GBRTRLIN201]MCH2049919.1 50S ribosomal protein L23 [Trichodesmium sp. ALOHA_ZT_67]MCL2929195.1 50S ribosomal protein L23 [Trichodesmium sp. MAG_R01]MDE5071486.1 50S ribosomal protein L23 [Trichodesmium sp. St5_bin8]MDE5078481.1 50S ribosomal protein L23 [Trichodesmium sp. St2_bin6]MDE5090492.1 50S ribos